MSQLWIVRAGSGDDKTNRIASSGGLQDVRAHPLVVHGDADHAHAAQPHCIDHTELTGILHGHDVAFMAEGEQR
jgi:hypothetical protein